MFWRVFSLSLYVLGGRWVIKHSDSIHASHTLHSDFHPPPTEWKCNTATYHSTPQQLYKNSTEAVLHYNIQINMFASIIFSALALVSTISAIPLPQDSPMGDPNPETFTDGGLPPIYGFADGDKSMTITDYECTKAAHCTSTHGDCLLDLSGGDAKYHWFLSRINLVGRLGLPKEGSNVCLDIEVLKSITHE
jgi:hypothetical protein